MVMDLNELDLSISSYSSGGGMQEEYVDQSPSHRKSLVDKEDEQEELKSDNLCVPPADNQQLEPAVKSPILSQRMAKTPRSNMTARKNDLL